MSLLNQEASKNVCYALRYVRDLLPEERRKEFARKAKEYVASGLMKNPPKGVPARSVLKLLKIIADLSRSNRALRGVVTQRGRLIGDLREICDPGRERAIFAQTNRGARTADGGHV